MRTLTTLLFTILFISSSFAQNKVGAKKTTRVQVSPISTTATTKTEKDLAKDFSLKVVKSYFSNSADFYYNNLSDNIYKLQDNKLQKKSISKTWIYDNFSKINRDSKTFADYKNSYKTEVLSKKELQNDARFKGHLNFDKLTDHDYLFIGRETKENISSFVWDDFLMFIVQKTESGWKISGTL